MKIDIKNKMKENIKTGNSKIEICTVGGYSEVGKNMTAIKYGDEVVICDMGLYLPKIIAYEEENDDVPRRDITKEKLIQIDAIPDDTVIKDWFKMTKAIVLGHCHLDHIGAVPYMAKHYNCPIYGTPYTLEILRDILRDERIELPNMIKELNANHSVKISRNFTIEFINMTHSTPQTVMIAIHTPMGIIVYANDFKFDNNPIIGNKPNYERLKALGNSGKVIALIVDSLYADAHMKTPSESVAREMLKDVMLGTDNKGHGVVVTTFASHIARLKSVVDFGRQMKRKVVFVGRSMHKYSKAAEKLKISKFSGVEIIGNARAARSKLAEINKNRGKYLLVCTGNQGEPNSMLPRIASKELPFSLKHDDHVIFATKTIPAPINIANRALLEEKLAKQGVRMFRDIHVSGHASREDHRDLIGMLKPMHIFPSHAEVEKLTAMAKLAIEMGYKLGSTVHLVHDGQKIELVS